jgi:hypothetical protein
MRNNGLSFIASILIGFPVSADPQKGPVLTGKDTGDNIELRLVAARVDRTRGQFLHAKFVPVKGEQKEFDFRFPGHSFTTHETTLMNVVYSCTATRQNLGNEWKDASLQAVFSVPKDLRATMNDFSHWYVVSIKVPDKK